VVLLGAGAWFLLNDGNRGPGGTTATNPTVTSSGATGLVVDPAAYIGQPADDVEATLTSQGLIVAREEATGDQLAGAGMALEAGDVADLAPTGPVPAGSTITLFVTQEGYTPEEEAEPTDEEPTETTAATTTTTAPSTSSSSSVTSTSTSAPATSSAEPPTAPAEPDPTVDTDGDGTPDVDDPEPENPEVPAPVDDGEAGAADPGVTG
jgi:serine/threonine-protein kinase